MTYGIIKIDVSKIQLLEQPLSLPWRPECVPSCKDDADCPGGHECFEDPDEKPNCPSGGVACVAANQCVPYRCPDVDPDTYHGQVGPLHEEGQEGSGAKLRRLVGEEARFTCKKDFVLADIHASSVAVTCAVVQGKERPVSTDYRVLQSSTDPHRNS